MQAPYREWVAGLLPLAEAHLEFQHPPVRSVVAQRIAVDHLAVEHAAKQAGDLRAAAWPKEFLNGVQRQQAGVIETEDPFPGRIGIEELPARAQRGDHFAGVLEQVAIAFLGFAGRLLLAQRRTAVERHHHQAFHGSTAVTQRRNVQGYRQDGTVLAAELRFEAGNLAGRQRAHRIHQCRQSFLRR